MSKKEKEPSCMELVGYVFTFIVGIFLVFGLVFTINTVYNNRKNIDSLLLELPRVKSCIKRKALSTKDCVYLYGRR